MTQIPVSEAHLKTYAELIVVHGLNVQPGQYVNISTEVIHKDLAILVAQTCYEKGAKYVAIDFSDPRLLKLRLDSPDPKNLEFVPKYVTVKYDEIVEEKAANLRILGTELPDILANSNPKLVNSLRLHQRLAMKNFYEEGIGKSKVQWCVVAAPTPIWASNVLPNLSPEDAYKEFWKNIIKVCRADTDDCLARWQEHNTILHKRASLFTDLKIKQLHFTGPGTDLVVELSPRAIFKGGREMGANGVEFEPNIPTEEIFTTPDFRKTKGRVKATRPFFVNGIMIEDLELTFKDGEISDFSASSGEATFKEYINSDPGAKRLGEVALVGIDSPIYQSGLVFREILFDENAACHIAVGSAYKFCLEGGSELSTEDAMAIGCNESSVHTDMMISSEEVNVSAITFQGESLRLITNGEWEPQYR